MYARIFTLISSLFLWVFIVYVSFSYGKTVTTVEVKNNIIYAASLKAWDLSLEPVVKPDQKGKANQYYFTELDRLSFGFYEPAPDEKVSESFIYSTGNLVNNLTLHKGTYIFGFYNPFSSYDISTPDFRVEPITNGSIYFTTETDGTISIFTLDSVARLYLISAGKTMTDLMLFPGNYIRFDPSRNAELDSVDLFRVITSLDGSNQTFEYVNPKIDGGALLTNYRFNNKNGLIQLFHNYFQEKVSNIADIRNKYKNSNTFSAVSTNRFFFNPSKRSHFLLLSLSSELTKIFLNSSQWVGTATKKISEIYNNADKYKVKEPVRAVLEQFITDGRFAIYGDKVSADFDSTYLDIASMIGITPTSKRSKRFQDLSNIYAKNIVSGGNVTGASRADVYAATSNILASILGSWEDTSSEDKLEPKDYFDIAMYSYNILSKSEYQGKYMDEFILDTNTHRLLQTFFQSSLLYYESIKDPDKKIAALKIFSVEFYDHIFSAVSKWVAGTFTYEEGGHTFLRPKFKNSDDIRSKIDPSIINGIKDHIKKWKEIINLLTSDPLYKREDSTNNVITRVTESIQILDNFITMVEDYRQYIKNPYETLVWDKSPAPVIVPPPVIPDDGIIPVTPTQEPVKTEVDPMITLKKIFPSITPENTPIVDSNYSLQKVPFSLTDSHGVKYSTSFSAIYTPITKNFTKMILEYQNNRIQINPEILNSGVLNRYLLFLGDYLAKIQYISDTDGLGWWDIRISLQENKIYIADQSYSIRED